MKTPEPSFSVNVDVTNPGQFFACCGLLELAHRLWRGAEGWFYSNASAFAIAGGNNAPASLNDLISELSKVDISGLSAADRQEMEALEAESKRLKKQNQKLPPEKESRRKQLGTEVRKGNIQIGQPFDLILNWWQTGDDGPASPKTWAGLQELHKIARAAQDALPTAGDAQTLFDHSRVLRRPKEYTKNDRQQDDPVAPFYFDARRCAHPLDAGFSLDVQKAETYAHPAVELLSLIGLQRFRPASSSAKWSFEYWTWSRPLSAPVAAGIACGAVPIPGRQGYRFPLRFRDNQKRYKAFSFATQIGDDT